MSAIEYRRYELMCDSPERHATRGAGFFVPRASRVMARVMPRAKVRVLAAGAGWTHVRSDSGRRFDKDYCPEHKAEAEEALRQRARRNALRSAS